MCTPNHYEVIGEALRPRWLMQGSFVYVDRITEDSNVLLQSTTNTSLQLNASDFDFSWDAGLDVSLIRQCWDDSGIELRYLDFGQLDSLATIDIGGSLIQVNSSPPLFAPNVQSIAATYTTELRGFELNYHYPLYRYASVLAGFRYVSFDDRLRAVLDAAPQTFRYHVAASNDLYGGQIGAATVPCWFFGCLQATSFVKVGIYGNDAEHESFFSTGAATLRVEDSADNSAIVGELGITAQLRLGKHVTFRSGYSLLFLERVAIGSDQVAASDFFNNVGSDDHGGAVFHGASVGVELRL